VKRPRDEWTVSLPQSAEYALRALAHLAMQPADAAVPARALARGTGVPVHYLSKVMRRLVTAGLVISKKGHGGGFQLARPAGQIAFGDVLSAADHGAASADRCAFGLGACDARHPCPLHGSWSELKECVQTWARSSTLADVAEYASRAPRPGRRSSRLNERG
jgi:Rrf2 family iron-sulfur cluster assembly transcriptional regulator